MINAQGQTQYSATAAREGREMNSDEQRADRRERLAARDAAAAELYPLGSSVTTMVHGISTLGDKVTGTVVDHKFGSLRVKTECYGTLCVSPSEVITL